jgi:hypothetical protein
MVLPHLPVEDDGYLGYYIPKGATISANKWAINLDDGKFSRVQAGEVASTSRPAFALLGLVEGLVLESNEDHRDSIWYSIL